VTSQTRPMGTLIALAAPDSQGLRELAKRLGTLTADQPHLPVADLARSLATRPGHDHRLALVVRSTAEATQLLLGGEDRRMIRGVATAGRSTGFLYPGVGDHHPRMAADLYRRSPVFRATLDRCCELAVPQLGTDPRDLLDLEPEPAARPPDGTPAAWPDLSAMMAAARPPTGFDQPTMAQTLTFAVEYALTALLRDWGITPSAILGYSIGEYTAACVAGVLPLDEAIRLVTRRAMLIERTEPGAMLAVLAGPGQAHAWAAEVGDPRLVVAAVDGPKLCVLSGPSTAVGELQRLLDAEGVATRKLPVRHAYHSPVLAPVRRPLADLVRGFTLAEPEVPVVSNVTGTWLTGHQATDPEYWARHMLRTVQFDAGLAEIWTLPAPVLIEVGPGHTLATLADNHPARDGDSPVLSTIPGPFHSGPGDDHLLTAVAHAWVHGLAVDLRRVTDF
jgi:acyl transferase domain-containing protein